VALSLEQEQGEVAAGTDVWLSDDTAVLSESVISSRLFLFILGPHSRNFLGKILGRVLILGKLQGKYLAKH